MTKIKFFKYLSLLTYPAYLILLIVFMSQKTNLHMDEVSSYCGANNSYDSSISIKVDFGFKYNNPEEVWLRQMTVDKNHRFDYKNVYNVMAEDNHPPFYFYLLHTICSFFPGKYSIWFGGILNILCAMGILLFARKITRQLTDNELCVLIVSCLICFSGGIISAATYIRNYFLGMLIISAYTHFILKGFKNRNWGFYIGIGICALLGVMTHYYLAIYFFFISFTFGIYLLMQKQIKDFIKMVGCIVVAAGLYILSDFASIRMIFSGKDRSSEVMNNLSIPLAGQIRRIVNCWNIVNTQVFSGLFIIVLIAFVISIIVLQIRKRNSKSLFIFLIPLSGIIGYILAVSVVTVYETPRYFYPVYATLLVTTFCLVFNTIKSFMKPGYAYIAICILFAICTGLKFKDNVHYLYRSTKPFLESSKSYSLTDCIFVTEHSYDVNSSFYEVRNYHSVTFYKNDMADELTEADIDTSNGLLLSFINSCDFDYLNSLVTTTWPELENPTVVGKHESSVTVYYSYSTL